ncbi:tripartite ATP-independent transporter DctP family solute receptor [Natranaerovirga hydrolytica]|uniref:Tripartite ATP-independent transporter DctP family solute receptor n=1 Tax=Natranaerovirga hydrolytica TaxID=680378 RepID=A0A4R1MZ35_9FIRM|nr:TRAP transporter substrate-binding protein [Natranaerovirga hydrolytica]TCK98588.1 tripartite ATP-independent transporter DctP family solute receptor [Natranaerovirga hydrolytica]
MNKKVGILLIAILSLIIVFSFTSSSRAEDDTTVLRFAYSNNSQPVIDSMRKFGKLIEEKTNGEVRVEYYPDSQLGGEVELIELTQTGAIDFTKVSASALEGFSKDYSIFGVPYIFDSEEHFYRVMEDEEIMNKVYNSTNDLGFTGLTYYDSGQRSFYMVDGPINTPEDLKGKKIRVMQSETAIKMIELLGGSPVPMGSSEVFTSLQSNLIDGAENNEFVLHTAGHGAVTQYYSYDEHTRVPDIIIMNSTLEDRLTKDQYQAVLDAAKESTEFEKTIFKQAVEEEKQKAVEQYQTQFNSVEKEPFLEKVQPLHDKFKNDEYFMDTYNRIRELADSE